MIARQHTTRIFPSNGRPRLHLRPRELRVIAFAHASLRHEIIDTAFPVLIARIPVLNGRVFHLGILHHDDLDDGGMQLVLVAHRSRAPLHVADIGAVIGNNQCSFELSRISGVDTEIGR